MGKWIFLFFEPRNNFREWQNEFTTLWLLTFFLGMGMIYVYYFFIPFSIGKNRVYYWKFGIGVTLVYIVMLFLYLHFVNPITGSTWQDAFTASIMLGIWLFVIWYLLVSTIIRYMGSMIKNINNGFLHKKRIPW